MTSSQQRRSARGAGLQWISGSRTGQGLGNRIAHQYDALGNRIQSTLADGWQIGCGT